MKKKNKKIVIQYNDYDRKHYVVDRRGIEPVPYTDSNGETFQTYPEEKMLYRGNFMECVGYLKLFKKGYIA